MKDTDKICLTLDEEQVSPLTSMFPELDPVMGAMTMFREVETLCGKKVQKLMTFTLESYVFYQTYGMDKMVCQECATSPDVALYILGHL